MVYFRLCHCFAYPIQNFFESDYLGYFVWGFEASSKVHGSSGIFISRQTQNLWIGLKGYSIEVDSKLSPEFLCKLILSWKSRSAFKGRWLSELFDVIVLSLLTECYRSVLKSTMQHLLPITCDHEWKICNWNEPNLSFLIMLAPYRQSIIV